MIPLALSVQNYGLGLEPFRKCSMNKYASCNYNWPYGRCRHMPPAWWIKRLALDPMAAVLADDIFQLIFLNENDRIPIQISLKLLPMSTIDNKPALV